MDGLTAEREQGITIDVAHLYFQTDRRKFIVADTPGHEQYTRNMASAASSADVAIILVDAQKGILPQTRRHALICKYFGIENIVLAVNKMDRVDYSPDVFHQIVSEFNRFSQELTFKSITPMPISALIGENIAQKSNKLGWFSGPTLMTFLEVVDPQKELSDKPLKVTRTVDKSSKLELSRNLWHYCEW